MSEKSMSEKSMDQYQYLGNEINLKSGVELVSEGLNCLASINTNDALTNLSLKIEIETCRHALDNIQHKLWQIGVTI